MLIPGIVASATTPDLHSSLLNVITVISAGALYLTGTSGRFKNQEAGNESQPPKCPLRITGDITRVSSR